MVEIETNIENMNPAQIKQRRGICEKTLKEDKRDALKNT